MTYTDPQEIEQRSFEIIRQELARLEAAAGPRRRELTGLEAAVLTRVIHTSADFDYYENLVFTHDAARAGYDLLRAGAWVVTDTVMAFSGIRKRNLERYGGEARCFIADRDVADAARLNGGTRARAGVDKAAGLAAPLVFAVGNAPTALMRMRELYDAGRFSPRMVIAAPVGFVNVEESKALCAALPVPCVIALGRKGGSAVAAAVINALLQDYTD
ncbi:MAG: precorrin-8X methylmutase [Spirochaetaceae bacterium]|jgi:precorrin-8X/cobalt-precorrin-8 methylmutase|nr:precorrin-8X methylmutase [Spirochaetaceae bacterium]